MRPAIDISECFEDMYQLEYFPIRGLGEFIRFLLEDNSIPYIHQTIQRDDWQKVKEEGVQSGQIPFGQLPVLKDGEHYIAQGGAIIRHLARKHHLYGNSLKEEALADMIFESAKDLRREYFTYIFKDDWKEKKESFIEHVKKNLEYFENYLKRVGTEYTCSNVVCFADYNLFEVLDLLHRLKTSVFDHFSNLNSFYERMKSRPNLAAFLASDRHYAQPVFIPLGWEARG